MKFFKFIFLLILFYCSKSEKEDINNYLGKWIITKDISCKNIAGEIIQTRFFIKHEKDTNLIKILNIRSNFDINLNDTIICRINHNKLYYYKLEKYDKKRTRKIRERNSREVK